MKQITTCLVLLLFFISPKIKAQDPNIILIIADDMGWSQISTGLTNFNNQSDFYETPTLATLASEGIAFPNGYVNGANCAPTRAALLSGQYAARPHNNIFNVYDLNRGNTSSNSTLIGPDMGIASNGNVDEIPASAQTIAEILQADGYATAHFGKFHVGENSWEAPVSNNNAYQQGFDYNFGGGTKGGPGAYHASGGVFHSVIGPELDPYAGNYTAAESAALAVGGYDLTGQAKHVQDAMAEAAIDFMDFANDYADPTPSADPYIHEVDYASAKPFFLHFSNFAIHGPIGNSHARPDLLDKYQNKTPTSSMGHTNNALGAILEGMDQSIGRIIDYLKVTDDPRRPGHKLSENTLVYFVADNGGAINTQENGPLRAMKGSYYEGGIRSVTLAWSDPTNGLLANAGTVDTTPVIGFDLYPTFVEMAGASLPGGGYDVDGTSLWPLLSAGTAVTRETLFWHFPGYLIDSKRDQRPVTIVRKNGYKLIHNYETADYELYNLSTDISETTNLLPSSDQAVVDIANDMITDMINHLTSTSAPLPTFRSGGATVPMPTYITVSSSNSTDGCQPAVGFEALWDFDTASNALDASGNGYDPNPMYGTLTYDIVDFQEGDQSAVFDGSTEIQYSDGTFLNDIRTARTVVAWIKPTALSGTQEIFEEGGSGNGLAFRLNGATIEASLANNNGNSDPNHTVSAAYPNDTNWHHVALVFNGGTSTMSIYIDGVLANSTTGPYTEISSHSSPGGIGGVIGGGDAFGAASGDSFFTGKMDAVAVYNTALSVSEIESSACYSVSNSTDGCQAEPGFMALWDFDVASDSDDASGNGNNPTSIPSGAITFDAVDFKEGDQSVVFDGTEAIQYATNSGSPSSFLNLATSTRSIMVWIKPTALSGIQDIFDEGGQNRGIAIRLNGSNLESIVRDTSSSAGQLSVAFPNDGDWHHIAFVYGSSNQKLYIDGVEVASGSAPASITDHYSYGGIGGKLSGNDSFKNSSDAYFTGKMDAFGVYSGTLTLSQIQDAACFSLGTSQVDLEIGKVYPNPFNNQLHINLKNTNDHVSVELYDVLGKTIYVNRFTNVSALEIPVQGLAKGLYLLKIKTNDGTMIKKVIKE